MADDNQIQIEIVLDDGSIQKGFAKIKSDGDDAAKGLGSSFSNAFKIESIVDVKAALDLLGLTAQKIGEAFKAAFDLSIHAEEIRAINAQFEALGTAAGIATQELSDGLAKAAGGLADQEDLLNAASKSIVELGINAQRLPEVMELARKATSLFGGDLVDRFEQINFAIATGSTRALKQIGINLDLDESTKAYARSLGLQASELNNAQLAHVRLNAVLEQGSKAFKNVDTSTRELADNGKRLSVSFGELGDAFSLAFDKQFGSAIKSSTNFFREFVDTITGNINRRFSPTIEDLKKQLESLKASARAAFGTDDINNPTLGFEFKKAISDVSTQLDILKAKREDDLKFSRLQTIQAETEANSQKTLAGAIAMTAEQKKLAAQHEADRQKELSSFLASQNQAELAARQQNLQFIEEAELKRQEQDAIFKEQALALEAEHQQALLNLDQQYSQEKGFTNDQHQQAIIAADESFAARRNLLLAQRNQFALQSSQNFWTQFNNLAKQAGVTFQSVMSQGIAQGFSAFGRALVTGENAMAAFGKAFIGVLGQMAVQLGSFYIAKGIAYLADPLTAPMGPPVIAAGIGLSIVGGALQALSGGGGGAAAAGGGGVAAGGGGGGIGFEPISGPSPTSITQEDQTRTREQAPQIQVVIQGDVLDSDQSAMRIAELLNQAYDKQGVVVRTGTA